MKHVLSLTRFNFQAHTKCVRIVKLLAATFANGLLIKHTLHAHIVIEEIALNVQVSVHVIVILELTNKLLKQHIKKR